MNDNDPGCEICKYVMNHHVIVTDDADALTVDVLTEVRYRCRACGRRLTIDMVPSDWTNSGKTRMGEGQGPQGPLAPLSVPRRYSDPAGYAESDRPWLEVRARERERILGRHR